MSGCSFFNGVAHQIDKWMGVLFIHKNIAPAELKQMDYLELEYWHSLWEIEREASKPKPTNGKS